MSLAAAAHFLEDRILLVGDLQDPLAGLENALAGRLRIGRADDLDLADHDRVGGADGDPAVLADEFGDVARGRDHGGFLHGHGDEVIAPLNLEVHRHAERQAEDADHVLDHLVGQRRRERLVPEMVLFLARQLGAVGELLDPLLEPQLVEAGQAGGAAVILLVHADSSKALSRSPIRAEGRK